MMAPRLEHGVNEGLGCFVRTRVRASAAIRQAGRSVRLVAIDPFVRGLPADVETIGELGHRLQTALIIDDELHPLVHERRLQPRH